MSDEAGWSKEAYERRVSSRCWWYTPYDDGWDAYPGLRSDEELRRIVEMEAALGGVPDWARQVAERSVNRACPCGHYLFPAPYLEVLVAIGSQTPPDFVHGCFTVERERKKQMMDYVLCLDAWLAGAGPEAPAAELAGMASRRIDWHGVCGRLWKVLGEHTERKDLLVERLVHSQRLKIKRSPWDDDLADVFGRDRYLGTMGGCENPAKTFGHIDGAVPGFDESASPRVQRLESRLAACCGDWDQMRFHIQFGWLCAPRAFRFLERLVWAIGRERAPRPDDNVPGYLQIDDTHPDQDQAAAWWEAFLSALDGWWQGRPAAGKVADEVNRLLGEAAPVKRWLVRLFLKKLRCYALNDEGLRRLVQPKPAHRRGGGAVA